MTGDTRPDLAPLPSAADIVRYMRTTGWAHGRQGSHGAMWTRGDVEFSVPHEDHNPAWLREVVARLASAEGRAPEETAAAVAEYRDARGSVASAGVPAPGDTDGSLPGGHGHAQDRPGPSPAGGGDLPGPAREAAYRAYRGWRIGDDGEGRLHAALVAAAPLIRAAERARIRRDVLARELILQHPEDGDRVAVLTLDLEQIIGAEDGSDG